MQKQRWEGQDLLGAPAHRSGRLWRRRRRPYFLRRAVLRERHLGADSGRRGHRLGAGPCFDLRASCVLFETVGPHRWKACERFGSARQGYVSRRLACGVSHRRRSGVLPRQQQVWRVRRGPGQDGSGVLVPLDQVSAARESRGPGALRQVPHGGRRRRRPGALLGRRLQDPARPRRHEVQLRRREALGGLPWIHQQGADRRGDGTTLGFAWGASGALVQQGPADVVGEVR
mmetsp:Transcript_18111/g.49685  ORF Transcript_18111/g.49685 Transcript_18111/m.49685 type:complete len:230 (+) Transcript_18111:515-1204(+)